MVPPTGVSGGVGGGARGAPWGPKGYKEREHEVPDIWKATTQPKWKKPKGTIAPAIPIGTKEEKRPMWAGDSAAKKPKFFTLKK